MIPSGHPVLPPSVALGKPEPERAAGGFAGSLDIPIPNRASSAEVMNRLVEGTVGYRLRSAAIRERGPNPHNVDRIDPPVANG